MTLVPRVLLFVTLAEPTPSGDPGVSRLCQGCSHPPRHLPDQAALSYAALLRQDNGIGRRPTVKFGLHLRYPPSRTYWPKFWQCATIRWCIFRHYSLLPFS